MKTIKCDNGVELTYYDTLKPGDLITAYTKGFHKIHRIVPRGANETPLFEYKTVFNTAGKPMSGKAILSCDASYCRPAKVYLGTLLPKLQAELKALSDIMDSLP